MRKSAIINLRIPSDLKAAWQDAAGGHGALSDWLRESAEARRKGHVSPMRDELRSLRAEINRLGSNVNQAMHAYHTGSPIDGEAIEAAYREMRAAVARALS